mmetsp:Transcript_934/g.1353  ORF Transcript_934/g.1353 Transcript_934/m.1353 type:complete len:136 (+) Transcript_934:154-561(+)
MDPMMESAGLPFMRAPEDTMRVGFGSSLAEQAKAPHPVQQLQKIRHEQEWRSKLQSAALIYGTAFAMKLETERQALSQIQRPPGLGIQSSLVGLETLMGTDTEIEFHDYLGLPSEAPTEPKFTIHDAMEVKFGLL